MKKILLFSVIVLLFGFIGCGEDINNIQEEGPINDAAFKGNDINVIPGGSEICDNSISEMIDVPWISQKLQSLSWSNNMCCGPSSITMIKGYVDGNYNLSENDLKNTIDWMDLNIPGFSKNNYNCVGTNNNQVTKTIQEYLGLESIAYNIEWCELIKYLDGNHIVIIHGDTQGGNSSTTFSNNGASHWLILERIDAEYAYINDPGRTYSSQGDSKKFTIDSVKRSFKKRGNLAVITNVNPNTCNTMDSFGTITSPINNQIITNNFNVIGSITDEDKIKKITVTIGTNQSCRFSRFFSGNSTSENFSVFIDISNECKLQEGSNQLAVWVEDDCEVSQKLSQILTINFQSQTNLCGNNIIDSNEQCDGSNLNNKTCQLLGFSSGNLLCTRDCNFDTSQCIINSCNEGEITSYGSWNSCSEFSDVCDETGTQLRVNQVCRNNSIIPENETKSCTRDTDGVSCSEGTCLNSQCLEDTPTCTVDSYSNPLNSSFSTATTISAGNYSNLSTQDANCQKVEDWYKINVNSGKTISVTINFTNSNGDLDLELYNSSNNEIANSNSSINNSETVSYNVSASGYYYIRVHYEENTYSMNVSITENCNDTCNSLGKECGNATVCGQSVYCGSCGNNETCSNNVCVEDDNDPVVTSVTPSTAYLNYITTFTVNGTNLPSTLSFWIAYCSDVTKISSSSTVVKFSCRPSWGETGTQNGDIRNKPSTEAGSVILKNFSITVNTSNQCQDGTGRYCKDGTQGELYTCNNGNYTLYQTCNNGCRIMSSGQNDVCN